METRSLKGLKKRLAELTENRLAQWLSNTILPIQPAAYHVSWWMPGLQWTILCWFWYSSLRHLLLATAGAGRGTVPTIFATFLGSCVYSKPSCSCLGSKVMTLWEETPRCLSYVLGSRCPFVFLLVLWVPAPVPSQSKTGLNVHMGAKKRRGFAKPDTTTVLPLWDYWWMFMLTALTVH